MLLITSVPPDAANDFSNDLHPSDAVDNITNDPHPADNSGNDLHPPDAANDGLDGPLVVALGKGEPGPGIGAKVDDANPEIAMPEGHPLDHVPGKALDVAHILAAVVARRVQHKHHIGLCTALCWHKQAMLAGLVHLIETCGYFKSMFKRREEGRGGRGQSQRKRETMSV